MSEVNLFAAIPPLQASSSLRDSIELDGSLGLAANSEFSRAVWMVGPILSDFWRRYKGKITLIAGAELDADAEAGLKGYLDFIIGKAPHQHIINAPIMVIVEAKRDNITDGFGQCIAGMVGAQRFKRRTNKAIESIYGCITTGSSWRFLQLTGQSITVDVKEYASGDFEKILGILTYIVGPVPEAIAA